jgi:glycosyltransferase involved in cell wall biosynthesis
MDVFDMPQARNVIVHFNLPPAKRYVMYTGTLDKFQRLDYLAESFRKIQQHVPDAFLVFVANQYKKNQLDDLRSHLHSLQISQFAIIQDSVLADLPFLLQAADVAVVPRPECPGFPMKILNYMAAGKAIVCFAKSGAMLEHGKTAILARDHDVEQFADHIIQILEDGALRKQLGANAKRKFQEFRANYSIEEIIAIYHKFIQA